ncbi:MAG: NAD(P)H-dependent oxidoreductase, partial [Planctomycetota bacterium]
MARLLFVEASPRGDRSHSTTVSRAFLDAYKEANPGDVVEELNVFEHDLPSFDGDTIAAKYAVMGGEDFTPEQKSAWEAVEAAAKHFSSFDKYVFGVPMWNFGVPYALKQYIDVISQPGLTFSVDEGGNYSGLCSGPAMVISARGGSYDAEPGGYDYEAPYMKLWCGFLGLEPDSILVQPTSTDPKEARSDGIE